MEFSFEWISKIEDLKTITISVCLAFIVIVFIKAVVKCILDRNRTRENMINQVANIIMADNNVSGISINDKKKNGVSINITKDNYSKRNQPQNNIIDIDSRKKTK